MKKLSPMIVARQKAVDKRVIGHIKFGMAQVKKRGNSYFHGLYNPFRLSFPSNAERNAIMRLEAAGKIRGIEGKYGFKGYVLA